MAETLAGMLGKANQAISAQANHSPQSVLQLLQ
jgi:flagellin-like hook-associated protein FlgL